MPKVRSRCCNRPHPIVSIWEAHQAAKVAPVSAWTPEAALVARPALDVGIWRLPPGGHCFFGCLADGHALAAAVEAASATAADFDLTTNLALRSSENSGVSGSPGSA